MKKKIMIVSVEVFICLVLTACGSGADELGTTAAETKEAEQDDITPDNFKVEVQTGADAMKAEENALVYSFEITDGVINGNAAADIRLGDIVLGTAGVDDVTAVYGHKYEDWEYKEYENLKRGVAELEYDFFPVQLEFKFYDDRLEAITCHIYV